LEDLAIHLQYQTDILVLPDSLQKTQRKLQGLRRTLKLARKMLYMWPQAIYNQSSPMESLPGFYHNYFSRLTGRNGEMRLFKELIEAANKKGFRGLIISGFPGVGKSRLLYEFNCEARNKGYPISTYHFREGHQGSSKTAWKHLIENLNDPSISTTPAHTVFEEFLHNAKKLADGGPVCIFLDNIHLAPEPFHDELIEAIDELHGKAVVLVATYQDIPLYRRASFLRFL